MGVAEQASSRPPIMKALVEFVMILVAVVICTGNSEGDQNKREKAHRDLNFYQGLSCRLRPR